MADYPTLRLKKPNRARVEIKPEEFRRAILTKGMDMAWEQASRCPCERFINDGSTTSGTGEFQSDCPGCYGRGVVYHSSQTIRALFEDASVNPKRFEMYGETASGMAGVTFLPEHGAGFLDRLTLVDVTMVYNETKIRRSTVERLRWPIATRDIVVGSGADFTTPLTLNVTTAYSRKADADGNLLDDVLVEGTDYEINDAGEVDWSIGVTAGTAPPVGQRYSMQYYGHPTYIVRDFPFAVRDTWIKRKYATETYHHLPIRAMCWLEYLGRPEWPQGA